MAKFKFSLEALLKQRRWVERERQRGLGEVLGRMGALERELQSLDAAVKEASDELRGGRLVGRVDLAFLAGHRRFVQATERRAMETIEKMKVVGREVEVARASLMEAAKARKVVEKLRERKLEEWKAAQAKAEQQEMDDVGMKLTIAAWSEEAKALEDERLEDERLEEGEMEEGVEDQTVEGRAMEDGGLEAETRGERLGE